MFHSPSFQMQTKLYVPRNSILAYILAWLSWSNNFKISGEWYWFFDGELIEDTITWRGPPQYKQKLFVCWHYFSCSMRSLNLVLSICTRSSHGEVVKGWANIVGKFCFCVINVGSGCLYCWRAKNLLSH